MKTISVPDMMCSHCVDRISNALNEAGIIFHVFLDKRAVTIESDDSRIPEVLRILEDLGFTPEVR